MTSLLIATRNAHKAREIQQVLAGSYQYLTLNDFPGAPGVIEDATTFAGNAAKKALALAEWLSANGRLLLEKRPAPENALYVLTDDSGLEVDALDGAPGVHSARFAALDSGGTDNSSDDANNAKLLRLLETVPGSRRTARFRCVLAVRKLFLSPVAGDLSVSSAPEPVFFEGVCEGRISLSPAGGGGFGYDPLFVPDGHTQSFAQLGEEVKNSLSHRAFALEKFKQFLLNNAGTS